MDDVRLYNRILSDTEIAALCPRDMRGLIFHAPYDVNADDYSGYGRVATQIDGPYLFTNAGRVGRSGATTGDGVATGQKYSGTFNVNTLVTNGGFSFSVWLYAKKVNYNPSWLKFYLDSTNYVSLYSLNNVADGNPYRLILGSWVSTNTPTYTIQQPPSTVISDGWKHVVVAIDATSTPKMWVNGILVFQDIPMAIAAGEMQVFTTNQDGTSQSGWSDAELDDLRIYDRALTQDDIDVLYAKDNTMGGCYDRTECATIQAETDGQFLAKDCLAEVSSGTPGAYDSAVGPTVQSSFPFYCSGATSVSFAVRNDVASYDVYNTQTISFKTEAASGWVDDVVVPSDSTMLLTQDGSSGQDGHTQYVIQDSVSGDMYMVHKFMHTGGTRTTSTEVQTLYTVSFPVQTTVDLLVIGGGGAGGSAGFTGGGGGGSGGGYKRMLGLSVSGSIPIKVGGGGKAISTTTPTVGGVTGSSSSFSGTSSIGGGGGGSAYRNGDTQVLRVCGTGAYGGGAAGTSRGPGGLVITTGCTGITDTTIKGGNGKIRGSPAPYIGYGGGGGGCGGSGNAGNYAISISSGGHKGGLGLNVPEFAIDVCGGGSGATRYCPRTYATHGGGNTGPTSSSMPNAIDGTGGGGGGGAQVCPLPGNGGSGVVMLRYRIEPMAVWQPQG
ncbi:hypothetical protein T484DRAFT_1740641 [Baffinella frigidus]|nr:hypothetical protein T484DRAFT_1740641 [Cryptophyta sp. CCMP2293]